MKQCCNYPPCVINQFSRAGKAPVGLSAGGGLISSSSLDWPWHIAVTVPSKTPLPPCGWWQSRHTKPELAKQARLEYTGTLWWRRGSRGISLFPHRLSVLVTLSSLSLAPVPRAKLFLRFCGSLQLSVHCLIGSGSTDATCICYLFVPISRCEAHQPTPPPGCATC